MHPAPHNTSKRPSPVVERPGVDRRAHTPRHSTPGVLNPFTGPLSRPMWAQAHRIPSQYPDTFDYSIYDRLYARYDRLVDQLFAPQRGVSLVASSGSCI